MHDLSFFLLKNWLPVGVAAIVFFSIGLLFAKFTWGRFSQRLTYAIEENMNLAGQWSALGTSQRDLFKKLRVRWQADREVWESAISEKENRIILLTGQFAAAGRDVPGEMDGQAPLLAKVKELEGALKSEREALSRLRTEAASLQRAVAESEESPAVNVVSEVVTAELQSRVRDLEQDLIDTHDKLHEVRSGYEKQLKLVEALEARLIGKSAPTAVEHIEAASKIAELEQKLAGAEKSVQVYATEVAQLSVLMPQRSREMKLFRGQFSQIKKTAGAEMESAAAEFKLAMDSMEIGHAAEKLALDARLVALSDEIALKATELASLESALVAKEQALADAHEKIAELEVLQRRKGSLQAELNDACHELYDVRRGLNRRVDEIGLLEARLAELSDTESKNGALSQQLAETRDELAATIQALSESGAKLNDQEETLVDLQQEFNEKRLETESLNRQLGDARRELSDVRLAHTDKVAAFQKASAEMEELEAIIEDRTAEVNDLSTELRTQRDLVRQLKNTLAEAEGELEALGDESKLLNAGVKAKTAFTEEQRLRIAALELSLSSRYNELNAVRSEADEQARSSRHFEAQAKQLGAELERRGVEFSQSDRRIATAEEAVEAANVRIMVLTGKLEQSDQAMALIQEELRQVSRVKDETIRDLDRATRRIAQLEEAAQTREAQLSGIEHELRESVQRGGDLELRLKRINTELESAREEQETSRVGIAELEESLRASDERTLHLSGRLEEKEAEVAAQREELDTLKSSLDAREAGEVEAQVRLATLQAELEGRLAGVVEEHELLTLKQQEEANRQAAEAGALRIEIQSQAAKLEEGEAQRRNSLAEIAGLQDKLDKRMETIRDLQVQINTIMMQRITQDTEISMLKEKLKAVEGDLSKTQALRSVVVPEATLKSPVTVDEASLAAAIQQSLAAESPDEEGVSLDDLGGKKTHHTPKPVEVAPSPAGGGSKRAGGDDQAVYFSETSAGLSESEIEKIDQCARAIRRLGRKAEVTIVGYAGAEGTADFTETLSARRADAVRERLLARGVSQALVNVRGAGQDRRFSDWKARRVEMIVVPLAVAESVN